MSLNTKQRRFEAAGDVPHMEPLEDLEWRECRSAKHGSPFWKNLKISRPAEVKEAKATADCLASASLYCKAMKAMVQTLVPETALLQLDDVWSFFFRCEMVFLQKKNIPLTCKSEAGAARLAIQTGNSNNRRYFSSLEQMSSFHFCNCN